MEFITYFIGCDGGMWILFHMQWALAGWVACRHPSKEGRLYYFLGRKQGYGITVSGSFGRIADTMLSITGLPFWGYVGEVSQYCYGFVYVKCRRF